MTQEAVAEYVGASVRQIQILTRQDRLPVSYALGPRSPRYDRHLIDAAMSAQCEAVESNGQAMKGT